MKPESDPGEVLATRCEERNAFLLITVVLFPVLSVALVGAYGLFIWISQMIFGPPGA